MPIRITLSTGEVLTFRTAQDYAKFLVFHAPKYEYEVVGETPRIPISAEVRHYAVMAARLRANKERNKIKK